MKKKTRNKKIFKILTFIFGFTTLILGMFFMGNFNQIKLYEFEAQGELVFVQGNATFNKQTNLLNITNIGFVDGTSVETIGVGMYYKERIIFESGLDYTKGNITIREYYGYEEYFTDKIIKNFDQIHFVISWKDENGNSRSEIIKMEVTKQFNNKFFYPKGQHI